jgi:hypothetical protein
MPTEQTTVLITESLKIVPEALPFSLSSFDLIEFSVPNPVSEMGKSNVMRDIHEIALRSRERPKKRQTTNPIVRAANVRKRLDLIMACDFSEESHAFEMSPDCQIVAGARLENSSIIPQTGQRKCGLWRGYGLQQPIFPCLPRPKAFAQGRKMEDDED